MKNYIKQNWKVFTIIGAVAVAFIIIFSFVNSINNKNGAGLFSGADFTLPANATDETPIMKDFVDGTMGLNDDLVDMVKGGSYIFCTKGNSNSYYASNIDAVDSEGSTIEHYLPKFSKAPTLGTFSNSSDKQEFYQGLEEAVNVGSTQGIKATKVQEGDYTFYAVPMNVFDEEGKIFGISWEWLYLDLPAGDMQEAIDKGMGIPTDIIRKKCDVETINEMFNFDFSNSFWNDVNYLEHLKCFKQNDKTKYIVLSPSWSSNVSGSDVPIGTFAVNGVVYSMDKQEFNENLVECGFETVDEAIKDGIYNPTNKGNIEIYE